MGWLCFFIVIAFIAILLACPVTFYLCYDEDITVKGRYLFFTYHLTDGKNENVRKKLNKEKKKKAANRSKKTKSEKKSPFSQIRQERGVSGLLSYLTDMAAVACGSLAKLFEHCRLSRYRIIVRISGSDPAETAKTYGSVCSVIMPISSFLLDRFRHEKKACVHVDPDFLAESSFIFADIRCKIALFFIVREALSLIFRFIFKQVKNNLSTGGVKHGRTCN